jgi:hypothetical protein
LSARVDSVRGGMMAELGEEYKCEFLEKHQNIILNTLFILLFLVMIYILFSGKL